MTKKHEAEGKPVVIKKYANRRLYDTQKSTYVTLDDLAKMVREEVDFAVIDAKSAEDITRSVLTQIIFEEEAKGESLLPAGFLRQLIRMYGDTMQGFVPGYLDATMTTFRDQQEDLRTQMGQVLGGNPALMDFGALTRKNMEMFQNAMRGFAPYVPATSPAPEAPAPDAPASKAKPAGKDVELDALKDQLAQMQDQLSKLMKNR